MRAVIQRVKNASVTVAGEVVGKIGPGILILLGVKEGDTDESITWLAEKCVNLRIFENEEGKFHYSLLDTGGSVLVVSQFTLYGDCSKGRRPSFTEAARPEAAKQIVEKFVSELRNKSVLTETGQFGAMMDVELLNDGPVTMIIDRD